jgi:hypothetical protein
MWNHRKRQPDPPVLVPVPVAEAVPVVPPAPKRRRSAAERRNDRIVREQLAAQRREAELVRVRAAARAAWEAARPAHMVEHGIPVDGFDWSRFTY